MTQHACSGLGSATTWNTASTTIFGPFGCTGPININTTTEANAQITSRLGAATLANLGVRVQANGRGTAGSVTLSKNSSLSALSASIGAGLTGTFADTSNTVSLVDTDKISCAFTNGTGVGSINYVNTTIDAQTAGQASIMMSSFGNNVTMNTAQRFVPLAGALAAQTGDGNILSVALESAALSNLQIVITTNTSAGFTVTSRKNAASGSQTISIGASATGLFEDISNTDALVATNTYDASVGANTVAPTVSTVSMKYTGSAASRVPCNSGRPASGWGAGTTVYGPLWGTTAGVSGETTVYTPIPYAATLSLLSTQVTTNGSAAGATCSMRGGASGGTSLNQTVALGTTTGLKQDITNTDSVSAGDLLDYQQTGASATIIQGWAGMLITGPNTGAAAPVCTLGATGAGIC